MSYREASAYQDNIREITSPSREDAPPNRHLASNRTPVIKESAHMIAETKEKRQEHYQLNAARKNKRDRTPPSTGNLANKKHPAQTMSYRDAAAYMGNIKEITSPPPARERSSPSQPT